MFKRDHWLTYRHFDRDENWGDADRMDPDFIRTLDDWRAYTGTPWLITSGTQGAHAKFSKHFEGRACDGVPATDNALSLFDLFLSALRFPFTGVGVYPHWQRGGKAVGGLHLEREQGVLHDFSRAKRKMWLCVLESGKQIYIPATLENFRKHGVV